MQAYGCLHQPVALHRIDEKADAAVRAWQAGIGVFSDGVIGPRCWQLLDLGGMETDAGIVGAAIGMSHHADWVLRHH